MEGGTTEASPTALLVAGCWVCAMLPSVRYYVYSVIFFFTWGKTRETVEIAVLSFAIGHAVTHGALLVIRPYAAA